MNIVERAALRAAMALAYPSFPCCETKRPACPTGFKAACTADAGLATLWTRHPGTLVGVPTGPASGLAVLDIDPRTGGRDWYMTNKGRLPETRKHRTRSGGLHLLFLHRDGIKCSARKIAPGVDTRGEGGYIIWWPIEGLEVLDAPLADWPEWLVPAAPSPPKQNPGRALAIATAGADIQFRGVAKRVARATEGERNSVAYWGACRAAEFVIANKIDRAFAAEVIALAACRAGLSAEEARRTVASAFRGLCNG
jgi:hypothetical protein